jgi:hypothetical protein
MNQQMEKRARLRREVLLLVLAAASVNAAVVLLTYFTDLQRAPQFRGCLHSALTSAVYMVCCRRIMVVEPRVSAAAGWVALGAAAGVMVYIGLELLARALPHVFRSVALLIAVAVVGGMGYAAGRANGVRQ